MSTNYLGSFELSILGRYGDQAATAAVERADVVLARSEDGCTACIRGWELLQPFLQGDPRFSGLTQVLVTYRSTELRELLATVRHDPDWDQRAA